MDDELFNKLKQLALTVYKTIDEGISNGTIQTNDVIFHKWKVDKLQYTDTGIKDYGSHIEYVTKKSIAIDEIIESIENSNEFFSALDELNSVFGKSNKLSNNLKNFLGRFIYRCLSNLKFEVIDNDIVIAAFLKDLRGEPVKYGAKVELQGIELRSEKIDIVEGITLRQPKIEDLEKEFREPWFITKHRFHPSAILDIEFLTRNANEIDTRIEQAIVIFRLFKVGGVKCTTYQLYSDSITDLMATGTVTSHDTSAVHDTLFITPEDELKLKSFWSKVNDSIPESFYHTSITKADYTTIAYNRYSDALLQNGIFERRIANAIMGLEALYFKPLGEMQELAYRLRIRVSKLLSILGYNPYEVKERINEAYGVRSTFLHGGQLDSTKKNKLESKYKGTLLLSVLDYLRISIIVNILILKEKEEFIDLIDDSLLDGKKEELLNSIISGAKEF
ncbi:MAG: hypothetical protein FIB08_12685 [Candidatus Methanoperedens sp.]|nr:hypothetical protein [Candidatus Methanoperedens sp.]